MRTLYGMEAIRYMVAFPVCKVRGHRWGPAGPVRCERCGFVDEEKLREIALALAPVSEAFRRMGKSVSDVSAAFAKVKRALGRLEASE